MKKILLMLFCVLLSISTGWSSEQLQTKRKLACQANPKTSLQISQQRPVKQKQSLKWQKAMPGAKAVAPAKAKKAPSRANETTEVSLPTFDYAEAAATVMQENADFIVTTTLYNESG